MIDQITVFLENSEGRLAALCRCLGDAGINMHALSVADTADFGIVRIIADKPQQAVEVLNGNDYRAAITQVAAIGVPNTPGGLADLLDVLDGLDLNIEYGYCFSLREGQAVDVLKIRGAEQNSEAARTITEAGFQLLSQQDIA